MLSPTRRLIILLLCCLLPVQGALAFARSVGMISHHAQALQTGALLRANHGAPAFHHQQLHSQHQFHHAGHPSVDKPEKVEAKPMPHSHASCTDCAKCCLTGAAAPPPAAVEASAVTFVLTTFKPVYINIAVHVPEKPERPPRVLPHTLT